MIENYIFDFGNVIVKFDPDTIMKPYIKDEDDRKKLSPIVFDRKNWDMLDAGAVTEEEVYENIKNEIPEELRKGVKATLENWYFYLPVNNNVVDVIKTLKANNKKVFLLSNISRSFAEGYYRDKTLKEIFSYFEGLVFSGAEGIVKPSREIFELILSRYGLDKSCTLFIDDNIKNINSAKELGIKTILFKSNTDAIFDFDK